MDNSPSSRKNFTSACLEAHWLRAADALRAGPSLRLPDLVADQELESALLLFLAEAPVEAQEVAREVMEPAARRGQPLGRWRAKLIEALIGQHVANVRSEMERHNFRSAVSAFERAVAIPPALKS